MASGPVIRRIESLFEGGSVAGLSDRQLLERFNARRDATGEVAFAALVTRYGPMVLHVCRHLLGDVHDAEDAFQAVFLVLARKARSIGDPDLLDNWLYGVALRTARKARVSRARQRKNEEGTIRKRLGSGSRASIVVESTVSPAVQPVLAREEFEALHGEIARLPGSFRLPVLLCYFEGLTLDEAARRLRWPAGTVRSRLARAREKLHRRLLSRGIVLSATALTAVLSPRSASAHISSLLCDTTTKAAIQFAAGSANHGVISTAVTALAHEVLKAMLINKLKLTVLTLLMLGAVATGAGYLGQSLAVVKDEPVRNLANQPRPAAQPDVLRQDTKLGRMTVSGRVLDPAGKPVAGSPVEVVGQPRAPQVGADERMDAYVVLGHGVTDADGRFKFEASRASSTRYYNVYTLAGSSPGAGFGCVELNSDAEQPAVDIRLRPEQFIRGKLVDVNGQPAAGVEVQVDHIARVFPLAGGGNFDGIGGGFNHLWTAPPEELNAWPKPVTSDDQGRFTLSGIGRGLSVSLYVHDSRFARQRLEVVTDERNGPKEVTLALQPATIIEGRTLAGDTGQPVSRAVVSVRASFGALGGMFTTKFRADDQGQFKANPFPGDYFRMRAFPPAGTPYLVREEEFTWAKGTVKKMIDLTLPRGVLIQGKVTEEENHRPVAGASVQFFPTYRPKGVLHGMEAVVASKDDGSFQVVVPPGKGYLLILGSTADYVPKEIGSRVLYWNGQPGGSRHYAHDIIAYDVKSGESPKISAVLRPGTAVRGQVVGPEGQTVEDALIISRLQIDPQNLNWLGHHFIHARDGHFELHELDPANSTPVHFFDADHQWGMTIELAGAQAGKALTIQLQPCGQAKARFVGPNSKPAARLSAFPSFELVMTPGPHPNTGNQTEKAQLAADLAFMANIDPKHYSNQSGPSTDAEGHITLPMLIPGALYRISDYSTMNVENKGVQVRKDFAVKPGETLDLGDILIEKPEL
jgi:RNA polymerase sigma factor (sigma-70 family)